MSSPLCAGGLFRSIAIQSPKVCWYEFLVCLDYNLFAPGYDDERVWCRDLQGLKSLVWILFVAREFSSYLAEICCLLGCPVVRLVFGTASLILRYAIMQHRKGNRHIWTVSLSRFKDHARHMSTSTSAFERVTITDYFATSNVVVQQQPQPWERF